MDFLISYAYASENNFQNSSSYSLVLMFVIFLFIFYFMIFRPQKQKNKEHTQLISSLSTGDEIITASGFIGKVVRIVNSNYIILELNDKIEVIIRSDFIVSSIPKGTLKSM